MEHDSTDILGQKTMPAARGNSSAGPSFSATKLAVYSVALFVSYAVGVRLWQRFLVWREKSYKLATRRRHGIPDDDLRPFNVAYTDAVMKVREEENRKLAKSRPAVRPQAPATSYDQGEAVTGHNLRQRSVAQATDATMRSTVAPVPGSYGPRYTESMPPPPPRSANDQHQLNGHVSNSYASQSAAGGSKRAPRHSTYFDAEDGHSDIDAKKRSWDTEQDEEHEAKKTRVEGDELIDGYENAEFDDAAPKRGSKRGNQDEDDSEEVKENRKSRGKRPRQVSAEKAHHGYQADQSMDVDDYDEEMDDITELKPVSRGKKRDRAEAGSTFGGDEDDSAAEHEADDSKLRRRRRKRRTVAKRKSEATYLRTKKRDRDGDEDEELSDESSPSKVSSARRKRGKRTSQVDRHELERQRSDVSMDESTTSRTTRSREIGEEWESNGVRYKIGLNGQRLRQALVKKARQKFVMPQDSQHPDRNANMQVCMECWLTEEEYHQAKVEHMLAWQDSPSRSQEGERLSVETSEHGVPFPQSVPGKSLLWSASGSSTPTMSPSSQSPVESVTEVPPPTRNFRSSLRHSIATSVGLPITPFGTSTLTAVKRISSTSRALSLAGSVNGHTTLNSSLSGLDSPSTQGLSDSTNGSPRTPALPAKVFSKWEKQELEAKAIMKVREANRKKEEEKEAKLKEERDAKERAEKERAAAAERAKQAKERQEREKAEREKQETARLEKEKKAKEAAAAAAAAPAAVPSITVTAPAVPTPSTGGAGGSGNSFFSMKPGETTGAGAASTPQPNFFAKPAEPTKPAAAAPTFSFGPSTSATPAAPTPSATNAPSAFPFPTSAAPTEQKQDRTIPGAAPSTGASLFSRMGQPAAEQPKPTSNPSFSFTKPDAPAAAAAPSAFPAPTAATGTAAPAPKFSFNFNKPAPASGTSSSLSGALGTGAAAEQQNAGPGSSFGFKAPGAAASGAPTTGAAATPAATGPKFNFGTSTFGSNSNTTSGPAKEPPKSAFGTTGAGGFGKPAASSASPFGGSSGASPFGNTTNSTSAFGGNSTNTTSAFGNTGSTSNGPTSAFGKTSTPSAFGSTTSAFGSAPGSTPSPFGAAANGASNPFGGSANTSAAKPAESKPSFSFGSSSGTTPAKTPASFGFGTTPAATSTTPASTPSTGTGTFKFGAPAAASTTPQASPFGAAASSGTSVFGNAAGNASSSSTTPAPVFSFGTSANGQQK